MQLASLEENLMLLNAKEFLTYFWDGYLQVDREKSETPSKQSEMLDCFTDKIEGAISES